MVSLSLSIYIYMHIFSVHIYIYILLERKYLGIVWGSCCTASRLHARGVGLGLLALSMMEVGLRAQKDFEPGMEDSGNSSFLVRTQSKAAEVNSGAPGRDRAVDEVAFYTHGPQLPRTTKEGFGRLRTTVGTRSLGWKELDKPHDEALSQSAVALYTADKASTELKKGFLAIEDADAT